MPMPQIVQRSDPCNFTYYPKEGEKIKPSDFMINIPASTDALPSNYNLDIENRGWIAVKRNHTWDVEDADIRPESNPESFHIACIHWKQDANDLAFPIDPRINRQDIEGATKIFPNTTNDGWLFSHAEVSHHHERIIQLEAVMYTLFEDLVHNKLDSVLKAVIGHNNPRPRLGTELLYNYSAQSGSFSDYSNVIDFRKECIKRCGELEKLLHVGQHVQEDDLYLKHQLARAIKQAKAVWKADTDNARRFAGIESQVDAIIARIETEHEIETRWEKAARIAAEKKKRAESETTETEN